ncbi:MAG: S8 family serine peptidase [Vicinamibacterales bacterium]
MTLRPRRRPLVRAGLTAVCLAALWVTTGQGQAPGSGRVRIQERTLPAMDAGLRAQDPPRDPGGPRPYAARLDGAAAQPRLYLGDSVIVKFRDTADGTAVLSAMDAARATGRTRLPYADFDIVRLAAGEDPEAAAEALRARDDVEYAQPRYLNHKMLRPNDQYFDRQWNLTDLGMERAWDIQPGATSDIVVAVLDTGVAYTSDMIRYESAFPFQLEEEGEVFPALGEVDVPFAAAPDLGDASRFVSPHDFIWDDDLPPFDLDGHGTHVTGTIGQATNNTIGVAGMAFNVRIMPVKVLDGVWDFIFGSPYQATDDVLARGIRYAADNGADIINMSLGRELGGPATAIESAIEYAVGRGVFVAIASGNDQLTGNRANRVAEAAPRIAGMMAVGAVNRNLALAYYSTTGSYVEIAAPGGDIRTRGENGILQQTLDFDLLETYVDGPTHFGPPRADAFGYYYFQGTSMATPHVSGFAALLKQQGITSPAAIEAAMTQFATDKGTAGKDNAYGYGLIAPRDTLRGLGLAR